MSNSSPIEHQTSTLSHSSFASNRNNNVINQTNMHNNHMEQLQHLLAHDSTFKAPNQPNYQFKCASFASPDEYSTLNHQQQITYLNAVLTEKQMDINVPKSSSFLAYDWLTLSNKSACLNNQFESGTSADRKKAKILKGSLPCPNDASQKKKKTFFKSCASYTEKKSNLEVI